MSPFCDETSITPNDSDLLEWSLPRWGFGGKKIGQPVSCWIATTFLYKTGALSARGWGIRRYSAQRSSDQRGGRTSGRSHATGPLFAKQTKVPVKPFHLDIGNTQAWASCRGVSTIAVCVWPSMVLCSFYCSSYTTHSIGNMVLRADNFKTVRRPSTSCHRGSRKCW